MARADDLPPSQTARLRFRTWRADDVELALGMWVDPAVARPAHLRQGLAAETARAVLRHVLHVLGAEAIFAWHHRSSERLLGRRGFARAGEAGHAPTGRMHPSCLLARGRRASREGATLRGVGENGGSAPGTGVEGERRTCS